jgi:predicted transcriptional regulator
MERVVLELDENIYERARRLAETRNSTLENLFEEGLEQLEQQEPHEDIIGLFADEPGLVDEMLEYIMASRQHSPLRTENE